MKVENQISVIVTGTTWMGSGIGSIESAMERLFREAGQEISLSVYSISTAYDLIFEWIENALSRGILIKMVVNRLSEQRPDVVEKLKSLAALYPHFHLFDFVSDTETDLHAKVVLVDRKVAIVGSSNLSSRGFKTNHEMALLVEGEVAGEVGKAIDRLFSSPKVIRR
jgi:phosphatidylserine/phosphatidylglycerophosphate/cardiolipin synthase-like enzyme